MPTSDYNAMLQCLNACGAKYLVVGGFAVMRYSEPRFTKDLDLWIDNAPENTRLVLAALRRFGAPVAGISTADLEKPEMVLQIGVAPVRVDIMTSVPGLETPGATGRQSCGKVWKHTSLLKRIPPTQKARHPNTHQ